jgi:hypothetical protein
MAKRALKIHPPIRVKTIEQTCRWVPSQWEGYTKDGRPIYVRYRWGRLSIRLGRIGGTIEDAVASKKELIGCPIGSSLDGVMTYQELKRHTRGMIRWPVASKR